MAVTDGDALTEGAPLGWGLVETVAVALGSVLTDGDGVGVAATSASNSPGVLEGKVSVSSQLWIRRQASMLPGAGSDSNAPTS